eukprot:246033-Rhodomonas_salina.1
MQAYDDGSTPFLNITHIPYLHPTLSPFTFLSFSPSLQTLLSLWTESMRVLDCAQIASNAFALRCRFTMRHRCAARS